MGPVDESPPPLYETLQRLRKAANMTQEQVAQLLGRHPITISRWERPNGRKPSEEDLKALARAYDTSVSAIRYGSVQHVERLVREATPPKVALGIPQRIRVWLQQFLLELVTAGVSEEDVDRVKRILSSDEMYRYYAGGEPKEYSEDETLEGIQAHAEAFRREFRRRGYKLPK